LLGCSDPLILRPTQNHAYQFIGNCSVYGLHDAIRLLGPLPLPWTAVADIDLTGRNNFRFLNSESQEITREDPRLAPLAEWKRIDKEAGPDDPVDYDFFQHAETGEIINYDPRLEPEALEKRGVKLTTFSLV
jgi:hypothetical protein